MNQGDSETAFAKINLALHVRARGADGYHRIETLFAFASEGDELSVEPADRLDLQITGPFAGGLENGDDNLVLRAALALRDRHRIARGARLRLDKRLPVASGIGGGSADAAASLRLLCRFWALDEDRAGLEAIARTLGADVPACLLSRPVRGEGRGDDLAPIVVGELAGRPLLLVNPRVGVSTAAVFAGWDMIDRGPLLHGEPMAAASAGRNDLEAPARRLAPEIDAVLVALSGRAGVRLARMSGSGATCFALFEDQAACDAADEDIGRTWPNWWRLKTALRGHSSVP